MKKKKLALEKIRWIKLHWICNTADKNHLKFKRRKKHFFLTSTDKINKTSCDWKKGINQSLGIGSKPKLSNQMRKNKNHKRQTKRYKEIIYTKIANYQCDCFNWMCVICFLRENKAHKWIHTHIYIHGLFVVMNILIFFVC